MNWSGPGSPLGHRNRLVGMRFCQPRRSLPSIFEEWARGWAKWTDYGTPRRVGTVRGIADAGSDACRQGRSCYAVPVTTSVVRVWLALGGGAGEVRLCSPGRCWAGGAGQTVKSRSLTPRESARCFRSSGSLVTTGAWYRTAVATTIASTTSAVPARPHATPAARPTCSSSGRMSQPLSTRRQAVLPPSRTPGPAAGTARAARRARSHIRPPVRGRPRAPPRAGPRGGPFRRRPPPAMPIPACLLPPPQL